MALRDAREKPWRHKRMDPVENEFENPRVVQGDKVPDVSAEPRCDIWMFYVAGL